VEHTRLHPRCGPVVRFGAPPVAGARHQLDRPVPNLPAREPQEKPVLPMRPPLRARHERASRSALRLPRTARPQEHGWFRPAGLEGSQRWLA